MNSLFLILSSLFLLWNLLYAIFHYLIWGFAAKMNKPLSDRLSEDYLSDVLSISKKNGIKVLFAFASQKEANPEKAFLFFARNGLQLTIIGQHDKSKKFKVIRTWLFFPPSCFLLEYLYPPKLFD